MKIAEECCERMELGVCPLFQEHVDPAVLADSARAYHERYGSQEPRKDT